VVSRFCAWLILSAAVIMSVVPPAFRPVTGISHLLEHFLWFLACGVALAILWRKGPTLRLYVAGVAFCAALEAVQLWTPGRHARLSDFVVNACAVAAGIAIARAIRTLKHPEAVLPAAPDAAGGRCPRPHR
jgi:VanZ family protein